MVEELDWETTFSPTNTSKDNLYVEQFLQNIFWTLGEDARSPERQANLLEWGRATDKDKKGDKGFWESILRRGSWRKRSFQVTRNPLTGGVIGELRTPRWKHNNAKRRKFCTEVVPNCNFQPKISSHTLICLQQVGAGCGGSGCGAWSSGEGLGLNAMKILQGG